MGLHVDDDVDLIPIAVAPRLSDLCGTVDPIDLFSSGAQVSSRTRYSHRRGL